MEFRTTRGPLLSALLGLALLLQAPALLGQAAAASLHGTVTDPSGSAIAGAHVTATAADGKVTAVDTGRDGNFEIKGLAPGKYGVAVTAKGFSPFEVLDYDLPAGLQKLDVTLSIEAQQQKVIVESDSPTVDVSPESNVGAIVMTEKDLEALSDDPDELQNDLEALAGPSAGPNGGQIYIDGFTAGQLPPKSAIREIRINQNPFSSEYDKLGYGRIEIFTKPGMDKLHGDVQFQGNSSAFNAKNPFVVGDEPDYESTLLNGTVGGPLNKKASFNFNFQYRDINDIAVVNAQVLDPTFEPVPFNASVSTPRIRVNIGPRIDYQVTPTNTLSVRYQYWRDDLTNQGVGGFALPSQAYDSLNTEHTIQIGDTQVFGTKIVNETRFQFLHEPLTQTPLSTAPAVIVPGAFVMGGNTAGTIHQTENHYEFQNYTQMLIGRHTLKFGARLRQVTDDDSATAGFNGTFFFSSLANYQSALQGTGGLPTQFSITSGLPQTNVSLFDAGFYVQDDWKLRPNITLSGGLRLETQTHISDHFDWAPRVAIAWGIGHGKSAPKTVLRAGLGLFYDRFTEELILNAERYNGVTQEKFVVMNPCFFPNIPPSLVPNPCPGSTTTVLPTIYRIQPGLHAPGVLQAAVVLERQLTRTINLSLTYLNARGFDQLLTNNINTPLPGTFPAAPVYPFGAPGNIYEYQSEGVFRQQQFLAQMNVRMGAKLTLFANYVLNYANADTAGASSFPSNPFNIGADYGRASFDYRSRFFLAGSYNLPHGFRLSPFVIVSTGQPYSITLSDDLIGSSQFNQRPAFASPASLPQNVVVTQFGAFDTVPEPGEKIVPINSLVAPARFSMNLRVSKTWGFGSKTESAANAGGGGGGPRMGGGGGGGGGSRGGGPFAFGGGASSGRRYSLTLSVNARNIFNYTTVATPSAVLNPPSAASPVATESPFFATPNALLGQAYSSQTANRIIYLQLGFSF